MAVINKLVCNKCGKEVPDGCCYLRFEGKIGFGSKYDGENISVDLCPTCLDELLDSLSVWADARYNNPHPFSNIHTKLSRK